MAYLNKQQLKKLIEGRPKGSTEEQILESLIKRGHTFEGIELIPVGVRSQLEPKQEEVAPQKGVLRGIGDFISETTGFTGTAKAISGATLGGRVAEKAGTNLTVRVNELITQAKSLPQGSLERKKLLEQAQRLSQTTGEGAERLLEALPTTKQAIGSFGKLGVTAASFGVGAPATAGARIGLGSGIGAGYGAFNAMEQNKPTGQIVGEGLVGGAIGAAVPAAMEGVKWLVKGIPKLLSYTSNVPEEVMQRQYDNPELASTMLEGVKKDGAIGVLDDIQNASKTLRKNLTQQYQEGAEVLIQGNTGARVSFSSKEIKLLEKVADDFGIDLPQNLNKFSVKEGLNLNKEINELFSKRAVRESAQGVVVRKTKELVSKKLSQFEGFKDFMSNYAGEKQVLDAINDIVKPYATNPVTKSTALSRIKAIFNDNRPAFLSAVKDLEEATGIPFLSDRAAALNILQKAPIAGQRLISQLIELVAFPVTSPRSAGFLSRIAGRIGQSPASQATRNVVSEGIRKLLR